MDEVVLDSASQIATPAFVSTLSICIVFAPMFLLSGVARYLFVPLAEAVVFAMLASYFLSRTIVPTMAKYLLRDEKHEAGDAPSRNPLVRFQKRFEEAFEKFRRSYRGVLESCLHHRRAFLITFFVASLGSLAILIPWLGRDFFPSVDSGTFKLHMRAPTGMRIEETANLCDLVERSIRGQIPAAEVQSVIDNIGLPYSGINLSYSNSAPVGTSDADILVTLSANHHPTDNYIHQLRHDTAETVSWCYLRFLARRHGRADSEFWIARSDRCSGCRQQPGRKPDLCGRAACQDEICLRSDRSADSATLRRTVSPDAELKGRKQNSWVSRLTTSRRIFWCR